MTLSAHAARCSDLLTHLYVLIPVLDNDKHYWVGDDEVEKLLRHGEGWLAAHPEREPIARRYLKHQPQPGPRRRSPGSWRRTNPTRTKPPRPARAEEAIVEKRDQPERAAARHGAGGAARPSAPSACSTSAAAKAGCCGSCCKDQQFEEIVGMDVSIRALEIATDRLQLDACRRRRSERIKLLHGSLMYRDKRLAGFDAAAVVEVIEHLDPPRLAAFERVLFEFARPRRSC